MKKLQNLSRGRQVLAIIVGLCLVLLSLLIAIRVAYRGRILPGITANGVYVSGLTKAEALRELNTQTSKYSVAPIESLSLQGNQQMSASQLGVEYLNEQAATEAMNTSRKGFILDQLGSELSGLLGQKPAITSVSYDTQKLSEISVGINTTAAKPVENAKFTTQAGEILVQDGSRGKRVDFALLPSAISNHFGQMQNKLFVMPILTVEPTLSTQALEAQKSILTPFKTSPLVLSYGDKSWPVDLNTIASWLALSGANQPVITNGLTSQYRLNAPAQNLYFEDKSIANYLTSLSSEINVAPVDAQLSVTDGRASIFTQSRDGKTLDTATSAEAISKQLTQGITTPIPLNVVITKAEVSDENIEKLGIKELISEGVTYFPGSPPNRLQNIRVGMAKFNGVLIKPGQNFSFNDYLGEVGAEQGYAPGLVILGDREEMQYGGGLCQVSSTAYRAALLAGLPITSRANHSFAVDYYTAPYGVPGVDATIYLPKPDMSFVNDTGHHILIQTKMVGTTLHFYFYGTKTKSGVIRGPFFVTGSSDATKPSQTVFYRDVLDLNGAVTKTDTVNTYYKSSLDFPITAN
ncbi:MAG: VanW family protein [Patescibacteria group bacterium]|nr:VanW family protein [Patescibacteria group bacterium]